MFMEKTPLPYGTGRKVLSDSEYASFGAIPHRFSPVEYSMKANSDAEAETRCECGRVHKRQIYYAVVADDLYSSDGAACSSSTKPVVFLSERPASYRPPEGDNEPPTVPAVSASLSPQTYASGSNNRYAVRRIALGRQLENETIINDIKGTCSSEQLRGDHGTQGDTERKMPRYIGYIQKNSYCSACGKLHVLYHPSPGSTRNSRQPNTTSEQRKTKYLLAEKSLHQAAVSEYPNSVHENPSAVCNFCGLGIHAIKEKSPKSRTPLSSFHFSLRRRRPVTNSDFPSGISVPSAVPEESNARILQHAHLQPSTRLASRLKQRWQQRIKGITAEKTIISSQPNRKNVRSWRPPFIGPLPTDFLRLRISVDAYHSIRQSAEEHPQAYSTISGSTQYVKTKPLRQMDCNCVGTVSRFLGVDETENLERLSRVCSGNCGRLHSPVPGSLVQTSGLQYPRVCNCHRMHISPQSDSLRTNIYCHSTAENTMSPALSPGTHSVSSDEGAVYCTYRAPVRRSTVSPESFTPPSEQLELTKVELTATTECDPKTPTMVPVDYAPVSGAEFIGNPALEKISANSGAIEATHATTSRNEPNSDHSISSPREVFRSRPQRPKPRTNENNRKVKVRFSSLRRRESLPQIEEESDSESYKTEESEAASDCEGTNDDAERLLFHRVPKVVSSDELFIGATNKPANNILTIGDRAHSGQDLQNLLQNIYHKRASLPSLSPLSL